MLLRCLLRLPLRRLPFQPSDRLTSPSAQWTGDRRQASLQRTLKPRRSAPSARLRLHLPITSLHKTPPSAPWTGGRQQVTVDCPSSNHLAAHDLAFRSVERSQVTGHSPHCCVRSSNSKAMAFRFFCDFHDFRSTHLPIASPHTSPPSAPWTGDRLPSHCRLSSPSIFQSPRCTRLRLLLRGHVTCDM